MTARKLPSRSWTPTPASGWTVKIAEPSPLASAWCAQMAMRRELMARGAGRYGLAVVPSQWPPPRRLTPWQRFMRLFWIPAEP